MCPKTSIVWLHFKCAVFMLLARKKKGKKQEGREEERGEVTF